MATRTNTQTSKGKTLRKKTNLKNVAKKHSAKKATNRKSVKVEVENVKPKKAVTKSKKLSTAQSKKTGVSKPKTIKDAIFGLFVKHGMENVDIEMAIKAAKSVKPDTEFDKWHFYFYRRQFRMQEVIH